MAYKVHNPIPQSLEKECIKCASIIRAFTMPNSNRGADKLIPKNLFLNAKGLAVITVVRAGFLVTVRAGSGLVVAKLPNGEWSAPSAIGLGGLGGGFEIGGEVTDFVFILTTERAVKAFSKGGNVTLGGNLSVAAGPLGRSTEAGAALRSAAAVYTYSRSKGLYAGISIEGAIIVERKGTNRKLYGQDVRAIQLLSGAIDPPNEANVLYSALHDVMSMSSGDAMKALKSGDYITAATYGRQKGQQASRVARTQSDKFAGQQHIPDSVKKHMAKGKQQASSAHASAKESAPGKFSQAKSSASSMFSRVKSGVSSSSSSASSAAPSRSVARHNDINDFAAPTRLKPRPAPSKKPSRVASSPVSSHYRHAHQSSSSLPSAPSVESDPVNFWKEQEEEDSTAWDLDTVAVAQYDFIGERDCDLTFHEGDKITVLTETEKTNDWWEGRVNGKTGIFPANYVKMQR